MPDTARQQVTDAFVARVGLMGSCQSTPIYDRPFKPVGELPRAWVWDFEETYGVERFASGQLVNELTIAVSVVFAYIDSDDTDQTCRRIGNGLLGELISILMNVPGAEPVEQDGTLGGIAFDMTARESAIVEVADATQHLGAVNMLWGVKYMVNESDPYTLMGNCS